MKLNKTWLFTTSLVMFVFLMSGSVLFNSCNNKKSRSFTPTGDTIADGKALVAQYCTSCHKLVPADAITKDVWKFHILPVMSRYLGLSTYSVMNYYKKTPTDTSGISLTDWEIIVFFFSSRRRHTRYPAKRPVPLTNDWAGFTLKKPDT